MSMHTNHRAYVMVPLAACLPRHAVGGTAAIQQEHSLAKRVSQQPELELESIRVLARNPSRGKKRTK